MNLSAEYLFSQEEIEEACLLLEKFFGVEYFKRGTRLMKDSDPPGAGMGRLSTGSTAPKLLLAWHRSREELIYASLQGVFTPGVHSAVIGVLGRCLKTLGDDPGVRRATGGLSSDTGFDRTFFLLWVAAGLRPGRGRILFPEDPAGCFYIASERSAIACLRVETARPVPPRGLSQALSSIIDQLPDLARLLTDRLPEAESHIFCIDLSGFALQSKDLQDLAESAWNLFRDRIDPEKAAVVLCHSQFLPGTAGVRWKGSSFPV